MYHRAAANTMKGFFALCAALPLLYPSHASAVTPRVHVLVDPTPLLSESRGPVFIKPPSFGCFLAADAPYDLFACDYSYYLYQDRRWYTSDTFHGPWTDVAEDDLPDPLRRSGIEELRRLEKRERDRFFEAPPGHYPGAMFSPQRDEIPAAPDDN